MSSTSAAIQVTEFVRALALGWKNLAVYPSGHPALVSSLDQVNRRLADLRGPAGEVNLGIASDGLIYGDMKIDSIGAQKFAQALYSRGVAILRFGSETSAADLETFLRLLAAGTPGDQKRALWDDLTAAGVMNINLQPVAYAVQVTQTLEEEPTEKHELSLWDEIVRALLEGQHFSATAKGLPVVKSADELARMIAQAVAAATNAKPTFDPDATFGVRILNREETFHTFLAETVGKHIAGTSGQKRQHSLQQAVQLIRTLPEPLRGTVLRAVAETLAMDDTAAALLRDFAAELPNDEVLEALRYLSSIGNLSAHAMSLLQSLTSIETSTRAEPPSASVIADLVELFGEDDVDRYNPEDHQALLASVSVHIPQVPPEAMSAMEQLGDRANTVANRVLTRQFGDIMLELIADADDSRPPQAILARLESLFRSRLSEGEVDAAAALLRRLQEIEKSASTNKLRSAVQDSVARLSGGEAIQALIDAVQHPSPEKTAAVHRLVEVLGAGARRSLLLALSEENGRSRRRRLFDFIASLGPSIAPDATSFLNDQRWFVVRNMIQLLRIVQDRTSLPEIRNLAGHSDLRLKLEALKSLSVLDSAVPLSLLENLLNDPDPKRAETAIGLVGSYGIKEGVDPLLHVLDSNDVFGARRLLRIKALRALGELGEPRALPQLKKFFAVSMLPWPSKQERYVAWESLNHYPPDARAPLVEQGLQSRDPQIRAICERLAQG